MIIVEKNLPPTNTKELNSVQNHAQENHIGSVKVMKVEFDGYEDVYNMEVENHHNFAVDGGFIVHNCMDSMRYAVYNQHRDNQARTIRSRYF